MMLTTFRQVLENLGKGADSGRTGILFERLMQRYLQAEGIYRTEFSNVWLWGDRGQPLQDDPEHAGHDYGVDLVAEKRGGGGLCAIQCKFYGRNHRLDWKGLTKFLSETTYKGSPFTSLMLVYTGKQLTEKQMKLIEKHRCAFVSYSDLAKSHVNWGELEKGKSGQKDPHREREHQRLAREDVIEGLAVADRGKLIMACGTGKTFVTLKIAEQLVGTDGVVLYLVPSISLMSQSMREWASHRSLNHRYIGVCSDTKTGRNDEDASLSELPLPVTTDPDKISGQLKLSTDAMTVVFSTYQSLASVSEAQKSWKGIFDLVICDEAHKTTGAGIDEGKIGSKGDRTKTTKHGHKTTTSYFHAVHDDKYIRTRKRLYTTATPKVYNSHSKAAVEDASNKFNKDFIVYSMDDEKKYGKDLHTLKFSDAINQNLLTDYKVVVLTVTEAEAATAIEEVRSKSPNLSDLNVNNTAKMIGCWKALRDPEAHSFVVGEEGRMGKKMRRHPLQRAIAFSRTIKDSQQFKEEFPKIVSADTNLAKDNSSCTVWHVDGRHNALERRNRLDWLEESSDNSNECRVLSNAKCLTEGVDVPALDAVLFLSSRSSTIDIIQAVGRVMRTNSGKKYGYIVIPIVIKSGEDVQTTLDDDQTYSQVWEVVRALRAHDDRIDQYLISGNIPNLLVSPSPGSVSPYGWQSSEGRPISSNDWIIDDVQYEEDVKRLLEIIRTKIADKVGDRRYLEAWAEDVAKIVGRIKERMSVVLKNPGAQKEFTKFHLGLKRIINDAVTEEEATDMLAQHIVMGRVFDALFTDVGFTEENPVSKTMNHIEQLMRKRGLDSETKKLEAFYKEIEGRVRSIQTHEGRQRVMYELYDKFFQNAFKRTAERLGIVYTPIEVVDFMLKSANDLIHSNFGRSLSGKNVHILDPFVGTGTFIARLISNDLCLVKKGDLEHKYKNEIHANEIVLLAYYVAAVNCESTFAQSSGKFLPFDGIVLTDTFSSKKIDEQWDEGLFSSTQKRIERQRNSPIMVIIGNPPWSAKDDVYVGDAKASYPELDKRLENTYIKVAKEQKTQQIASLYDSYIRSIRWASDRIGVEGVIVFITNAGFLRSDAGCGVRACLAKEFNEIWCLDLRGHALTKGEPRKREGGNVFGMNSKAATAITILIKNSQKHNCVIHYKDIGDYMTKTEKLMWLKECGSISNIKNWVTITPDKYYDWIDQRLSTSYEKHIQLGNKETKAGKTDSAIFKIYSRGAATSRDSWAYNSNIKTLAQNMNKHIEYCNLHSTDGAKYDERKAKGDEELIHKLKRYGKQKFDDGKIRLALYRPFFKQYLYFDKVFNSRQPKFFPLNITDNLAICISYKLKKGDFSAIVTDVTPDIQVNYNAQCFPLFTYDGNNRIENINNSSLAMFRSYYNDHQISAPSIFFYVYGILHHPGYVAKFSKNLAKEMPRIPLAPNFKKISEIGKLLADLHLKYETCPRYNLGKPMCDYTTFTKLTTYDIYVNNPQNKLKKHIVYGIKIDGRVMYDNIPIVKYKVNGRSPVEWVIDRYKRSYDKTSGIVNNPCSDVDIVATLERAVYVGITSDKLIALLPKEFEQDRIWKSSKNGLDAHI